MSESSSPPMNSISVCPWNPQWGSDFARVRTELDRLLNGLYARIEHVGSTSVKGLWAKPILDIDIIVTDDAALQETIARLASIGFSHRGNLGIEGREAFSPPSEYFVAIHLYAGLEGTPALVNHLAVRDALRSSEALRERYSSLKRDLAASCDGDIDLYVRQKTDFIMDVLKHHANLSSASLLAIDLANRENVALRPARPGDEYACSHVHIQCWREAYEGIVASEFLDELPARYLQRVQRWKAILANQGQERNRVLVAVHGEEVVGFASAGSSRDEQFANVGELWSLYLLRAFNNKKIGYLLLCQTMKFLRTQGHTSAFCWVLEDNPTRAFYERTGARYLGSSKRISIGSKEYNELALHWDCLDGFE